MATARDTAPRIPANQPTLTQDVSELQAPQQPPAYYEPQSRDFYIDRYDNGAMQGRQRSTAAMHDPDSDSLASSVLPTYAAVSKWAHSGYRSEREYLEALREFVEEKSYSVPVDRRGVPTTLTGFYGKKTTEEYVREARAEKERRKEIKQIQKQHDWEARLANKSTSAAASERDGDNGGQPGESMPQRRRRSLREWMQTRRD